MPKNKQQAHNAVQYTKWVPSFGKQSTLYQSQSGLNIELPYINKDFILILSACSLVIIRPIPRESHESNPDEMEDFDLAFAQEALARAYALAGDLNKARKHHQKAVALGEAIKDQEDRKIFLGDFQGGECLD